MKLKRRRQLRHELLWRLSMLRSYVKVAHRSVLRQKGYAAINVVGLAVGLAFCTLILLYVRDELTFDRFHAQSDRIYRVYKAYYTPDGGIERKDAWLPAPQGPAMKSDLPEVDEYVRVRSRSYFVRRHTEAVEEQILFADASLFDVFTFPLLKGDPGTALADPSSIVLTESMALKYFGDQNPMGGRLAVRLTDRFEDFVVTGVAADVPGNSSIQFGLLAPFVRISSPRDDWYSNNYFTYVRLKGQSSPVDLEAKLVDFRLKYFPNQVQELRDRGNWTGDGLPVRYHLQPLTDIHLDPTIASEPPPGDPTYSYVLASLAIVVLVVGCINFTTLALGRSAIRAREIGVRKVVGARRTQIMLQFWGEALILSILALVVGLGLAGLSLPVFNELADKSLRLDFSVGTLSALLGLAIATALLAGCYPALLLSSLRPVETLKNRLRLGGSRGLTRSLVVVQFALSIFLVVSALTMLNQLRYMQTRDLGFDKEQVVVIPVQGLDGQRMLRLMESEVGSHSGIVGLTGINNAFARGQWARGFKHEDEEKLAYIYRVEIDFMDVLGMELLAGRNFDPLRATDSSHAVIINEALARDFGWADPVGKVVSGLNAYEGRPDLDPTVIGIVKDFNFRSLHRPVEPMMMSLSMDRIYNLLARVRPNEVPASLAALRAAWENLTPDVPFTYSFLDDDLDRQYRSEERWSRIIGFGSLFAILVACLGLFGLGALAVTGRTKEIGIRKVLGASVSSVMVLISKEFAWLVLVAIALAAPAAYFAMSRWLGDFAYRIDIGPGVFLLTGMLVLITALATVSYQSLKAGIADPVKSLRHE
jgi:putative ABC transport system permease protein